MAGEASRQLRCRHASVGRREGVTVFSVASEPIYGMELLGCLSFHMGTVSELEVAGLLILMIYLEVNFSFQVSGVTVSHN